MALAKHQTACHAVRRSAATGPHPSVKDEIVKGREGTHSVAGQTTLVLQPSNDDLVTALEPDSLNQSWETDHHV
jgi:hypothetical protein